MSTTPLKTHAETRRYPAASKREFHVTRQYTNQPYSTVYYIFEDEHLEYRCLLLKDFIEFLKNH